MSIKVKLIISASCFIVLVVVMIGFAGFYYIRPHIENLVFASLKTGGYVQEQRVEGTVERYRTILEAYASRTLSMEFLAQYYNGKSESSLRAIRENLNFAIAPFKSKDDVSVYEEVLGMGIIGKDGKVLVSAPDENYAPKCTEADVYSASESKDYFSVFKDGDVYYVEGCRPLIWGGEKLGILVVVFNPKSLRAIASDYSIFGKTGETLIAFKNDNNEAEYFIPRRFGNAPNARSVISLSEKKIPIVHAVLGEDTFLEDAIDYRGVPVVASTFFVPGVNWGLVTKMDAIEALSPINILFILGVLLILLSVIAGGIFIYFIVYSVAKPISELSKLSAEVAKGNFDISLSSGLRSVKSEMGQLVKNFFEMTANLRELYKNLDKKVVEKTRDLETSKNEIEKQKVAILNILEDVEKEKEETRLVAQNLEKFKLAVESASDQIVITDTEGAVLYINKATEFITGYLAKDVIGNKAGKLWGGLMEKDFYAKMWKIIKQDKKTFKGEIKNKRKNGQIYDAEISVSPVLNEKGGVEFFVGIERDITEAKEIDRAKSEFVSLASHQLRTPLTAISWYLEEVLGEKNGKLNKHQKEYLDEVQGSNKRMIDLVSALLNISRIELGTFAVMPKPTDLIELAEDAIKDIAPQAKLKKIEIGKEYDKNLPQMNLDPGLITVIFQNLISNSIKYTPEGGKIIITIKKDDKNALISVKDTGYGIPKDAQSEIFDKFYRADNARAHDPSGNGLGLYIVKAIVAKSSGEIWFESPSSVPFGGISASVKTTTDKTMGKEENKGTTFFVSLPLESNKK